MWKKHRSLGMLRVTEENPTAARALKILLCLPLLPSDRIPEGYRTVVQYVRDNYLFPTFEQLLMYIQEYWLDVVGAGAMSVAGLPHRTNNGVESFYRQLNDTVGRHPSFWDFLG